MLKSIFISILTLVGIFVADSFAAEKGEKEGGAKKILIRVPGTGGGAGTYGNSLNTVANLPAAANDTARKMQVRIALARALGIPPGQLNHPINPQLKKGFSGLVVKSVGLDVGKPHQSPPKFNISRMGPMNAGLTTADRVENRNWSNSLCNSAFVLKLNWHVKNTGNVPTSFGKIISANITITDDAGIKKANGIFELCSWIGENEYHFNFELNNAELIQRNGSGFFTASGTALLPELAIPPLWQWKLHATSEQFNVASAMENGVDITADFTSSNMGDECIDIFFKDAPPATIDTSWINVHNPNDQFQFGYCMGRCDATIINTD